MEDRQHMIERYPAIAHDGTVSPEAAISAMFNTQVCEPGDVTQHITFYSTSDDAIHRIQDTVFAHRFIYFLHGEGRPVHPSVPTDSAALTEQSYRPRSCARAKRFLEMLTGSASHSPGSRPHLEVSATCLCSILTVSHTTNQIKIHHSDTPFGAEHLSPEDVKAYSVSILIPSTRKPF